MPFTIRGVETSTPKPQATVAIKHPSPPKKSKPAPPAPAPTIAAATLTGGYYVWSESAPGYAPYKNDILRKYQDALSSCGIPRTDQLLFLQQLTQENGALDVHAVNATSVETSFGIGQWNIKPRSVAYWKSKYPEQFTIEWQVKEMARTSCEKYTMYKGDVRRAIVHHNCPACARADAIPQYCGGDVDSYRDVLPGPKVRKSCYFKDEVNGPSARKRFVASR